MPTRVGPHTQGEENLVFGYDLGDVSNSYRGEPTENLITDTAAFDSSFWNQKSGTITANSVTGPRGIQNAAKIVAVNTDPYIYSSAIVTASTGNVTWSIWVKGVGNTVGKSAQVRINFSGTATGTADTNASVNLTSNWQLLQTTANVTGAGTIKFGLEAPNSAVTGDIMYFADPMFEQKNHATPFTAGTRSVSGSLLDLTGNSTIDLTNVSFDSNAQMTFDGTDDYIQTSEYTVPATGPLTVEFLYKRSTAGGRGGLFERKADSPYNGMSLGQGASNNWSFVVSDDYDSAKLQVDFTYPSANTWYHDVGVFNGSNQASGYRNGELIGSASGSNVGNLNTQGTRDKLLIMKRANSTPVGGDVVIVKIYNRVLTATEIQQNYNAQKSRFGI